MAFLRIHCDYCGGTWDVYKRDIKTEDARKCPHCFQKIDAQTWKKHIIPAFGTVEDANMELVKDAYNHLPLYSFDVIANHLFRNRKNRPKEAQKPTENPAEKPADAN